MLFLGEPNTGGGKKGLPISTKINQVGLKRSSVVGKSGGTISPNNNKQTGLGETAATGRAMNEDSMTRLLSSGNQKNSIGIINPDKTNAMGPYLVGSPKKSSNAGINTSQPVSASEPQRSLIKGRGQYYKNYGAQPIGMTNTMYSGAQQTAASVPGTAEI